SFPRRLDDFDIATILAKRPDGRIDLPDGFPDDWVESDSTVGNCVSAHVDASGPPLRGVSPNAVITFNPPDATGDDQKVLNIFYYNCLAHDYFYLLGFREADGNFQKNNFNRGGIGGDRVDACAYRGTVWATANMSYPVDGKNPIMNMG